MKYGVYSMRDKQVGFTEPKLFMNDKVAVRNFAAAINNSPAGSDLGFAPGDFDLYKLGEFDTEKGIFTDSELLNPGIPEFIVSGSSVYGAKDYAKEI